MTKKGAGGQVLMVFGQAKGNKKPKKTHTYYLCGKTGHIAKKNSSLLMDIPSRLNPPIRARDILHYLNHS